MSTIGVSYRGLIEHYKNLGGSAEQQAVIAEVLAEVNEFMEDSVWTECNNGTFHKSKMRAMIPGVVYRLLYGGVPPSRGAVVQVTDATCLMQQYIELDEDEVEVGMSIPDAREGEFIAHAHGMSEALATSLIYGNTDTDPEQFMGLAARYSDLSAGNGGQIVDAGGTGSDNTSAYFCVWSPQTLTFLYPKGSQMGLKRSDKGLLTVDAPDGAGKYEAWVETLKMKPGLAVPNYKSVVRVANIDVSDLNAGSVNLINTLIKAKNKLHHAGARFMPESLRQERGMDKLGRPCLLVNSTLKTALDIEVANKSNIYLTRQTFDNTEVLMFDGIPIRQMDAILDTEERVT